MKKKKVLKHLKGDMKMFKKEANEDKELMKDLKKPSKKESKSHEKKESKSHEKKEKTEKKVKKVMKEFGKGELHSGSKKGPKVTNPKQALAIGYSEAKEAKKKAKKKKK